MSAPPPYPPNENPDRRPLPPGWVTQYESNYRAWFYVNTGTNPPVTTWTHPLGAPPSPVELEISHHLVLHAHEKKRLYSWSQGPPPNSYGSPAGPPPGGYNGGYNDQYSRGGYSPGPGYGQSPPPQPGYYGGPPPQQGYGPGPGYGGYREEERGFFNRPGSNPPPQQVVYEQAPPPQKSGMSTGKMLGIGAAGLVGGAIIGDLIENHEENEQFDAYQDGVQDGRDEDYGGGDDYGGGGGDW